MNTRVFAVAGLGLVAAFVVAAQERVDRPAASWPALPYWLPSAALPAERAETPAGPDEAVEPVALHALPLVAIPPCRLLDTEAEGRPALLRGESLEIAVLERCGVPATAQALSVRLEAVESTRDGALVLGGAGTAAGDGGRVRLDPATADAVTGIVPLDESGRLVIVSAATSSRAVLDVNGYYAAESAVRSLNALAGDVTLQAGESIAITSEGNTVTIAVKADERPGVDRPESPARPQVRSVLQVQPSRSITGLPPARAMAPPSSSMYVAGALGLPDTTALGAGVLTLGGDRFLHNYGTRADAGNTFVGENAGNLTTEGADNTAIGYQSLGSNTLGNGNTATGRASLYSNSTGWQNTATGSYGLHSNTTGYQNTASGISSLYANTTGHENTASGSYSLRSNATGCENTAVGSRSLFSNTTGSENTATGRGSLSSNTTGCENTATGWRSLYSNTIGSVNTASDPSDPASRRARFGCGESSSRRS